jgi:NAD(P)-dependent dehydrogenase (short-subunit alcohol dehydrogenase family)
MAMPPKSARPVALVTGSTSGIGAAIARRLAAGGYAVALHSRNSTTAGQALAEELGDASYTQADLADERQAAALVERVVAHYGRLDVLVNNAGVSGMIAHADLAAATPKIWRQLYDVNVIAPWILVTAAEAHLRASADTGRPGAIVNITSHAGVRPKGASIPYAASKAALNHLTKLLAVTLAPAIRVNAVAPGLVDTPLTAGWDALRRRWQESAPMRRAARPDEVADIVYTLIASDYITGEVVLLDGGLNLT